MTAHIHNPMELSKNFAEIERKFLLKEVIPSNLVMSTIQVDRYYLYVDPQAEIRIQQKGEDRYEMERKISNAQSPLLRRSMKASITADEFQKLRKGIIGNPITYLKHSTNIQCVSIKEYLDQFKGLAIVEIEFADLQSAQTFHPSLPWMGAEISDRTYARDSGLIYISGFKELRAQLPK